MRDREVWHALVHGVTKSWTWLSNWTTTTPSIFGCDCIWRKNLQRGNKMNKRLLGLGSSPAGLISYTKWKISLGCRKQGKAMGGCRGRRPSASQGERPQEKPTLWALWPQISSLQKYNTVLLFKTPSLWYFITAEFITEFHSWFRKILWRRKRQLTPVSLPGKSHEQRSLVCYRSQELDTT